MVNHRNGFLDFTPSQEEAVVSRILVLVHQAVDENFPNVEQAGRQFTKTIFSHEGESTASSSVPGQGFSDLESTGPGGHPQIELQKSDLSTAIPPPPAAQPPLNPASVRTNTRGAASSTSVGGSQKPRPAAVAPPKQSTPFSEPRTSSSRTITDDTIDWSMRLMMALFIAGVIVLVYSLIL